MHTVIELVEMTKYTAYGGFDKLNHRKLNFLVSPYFFLLYKNTNSALVKIIAYPIKL